MSRTSSTILQSLFSKLPIGWALRYRGGVMGVVLGAVAEAIADAEAAAEAMMNETDPRLADKLLSDFERCLGPDPCGRDKDGLTVQQRRQLAFQRWTARGGQSIPYFVSVAAALGVTITVEEFWPSRAGVLRAGQRLRPEGSQFVWRVNIPGLVTVTNFRAGASRAGHRLGSFEVSAIECVLRRYKPAHISLSGQFVNAETAGVVSVPTLSFLGASNINAGRKFAATLNGVISTNGGGANFFPGPTAGIQATGGQYA